VRSEARVCRYCGHEFGESIAQVLPNSRPIWGIAIALVFVALAGWLTYSVWRDLDAVRANSAPPETTTSALALQHEQPHYEPIALGSTFEWVGEDSPDEVLRQAGPFVVSITKRKDADLVQPLVKVTSGSQSVTMEGESVGASYPHKISFIQNRSGGGPAVMLQSFSGGAHCCNSVQVAGLVGGRLKVVDLGSWDGDNIAIPQDVSGDGTVDFVMYDNSFLYAFASYADSYAPPKIFNIIGGEAKDVSGNPAFRSLFGKSMQQAGERCRPGSDAVPNGACAAFVASAARIGKLNQAWPQMLAAYDASSDWDLPTGCTVSDDNGCPTGAEIVYKSYPEALLAFLKREGYVPKSWLPPEAFQRSQQENAKPGDDYIS
jgi:hypothetical protein